jgi:hypothetical protein
VRDSFKATNVVSFSAVLATNRFPSSGFSGRGDVHLDSTSRVVFWADAIFPTAPGEPVEWVKRGRSLPHANAHLSWR